MARPLRVDVEDGWYHVISRGIERREIFRDDADRRDFLERLFDLARSHRIAVHGYCLMENHFHLQVKTPDANLKSAMQRLLSGYVVRFNLRHHRVGPLFQGRYQAILSGEKEWLTEVNRYIHLNPVRLESLNLGKKRQAQVRRGVAETIGQEVVSERLSALRDYPWSSYRAYVGYICGPSELQKDDVLGCFKGPTKQQRMELFREYTESAIREGIEGEGLSERIRYGTLLGSEEWTARMRTRLRGDLREQPALERARRDAVGFEEVAGLVRLEFGESWEDLVKRRHPARGLVIVLCRRYTALKLSEIGDRCGGMDYAAVAQAQHRMENKLSQDRCLAAAFQRIAKRLKLSNVET